MTALLDDPSLPENLSKTLSIPLLLWNSPRKPVQSGTGSRTCMAQNFINRAKEAAEKLSMSQLADITELDDIGIPVFSATCPQVDEGLITVFSGKGINKTEASLSAMMELVERVSASARGKRMIYGTFQDINEIFNGQVLNPSQLIIHRREIPVEVIPISWTWSFDLKSNSPILVPATAVFHPFYDDSGALFINNSCGLASGTSILEATIQALCEVVERDAISLAMASNLFTSIPIETINSKICSHLIQDIQHADIDVSVKEITTNIGVPCFAVCGDDQRRRNSFYLNGGYGCQADREKALTRAIVELAQSRATIISGVREDIPRMREGDGSDYVDIRKRNYRWFNDVDPLQSYEELPTYKFNDLWEELKWLTGRVRAAGLPGPLIADLTHQEVGIPVVRVIVPGLECWHHDGRRRGSRLAEAFKIGRRLRLH